MLSETTSPLPRRSRLGNHTITRQQAPAWNAISEKYTGNPAVAFGDVLLSENQVRTGPDGGALNPGAGGWPTIRYFNKETGYDGKEYPKKTDKAMCDELGDEENMEAYVTELGGATLCSVADGAGCDDKETGFIEKWKGKGADDVEKQVWFAICICHRHSRRCARRMNCGRVC